MQNTSITNKTPEVLVIFALATHVFRKQIVLDKNKITRQEAIKKLKEAKDLFDSGIINSKEYEVFSNKYKPIIININD